MLPDAEILARLSPDTILTTQISAGALAKAMAGTDRGPATLSTRQAAALYGWRHEDWARWARDGLVPGALREGTRGWNLAREGCEALHRKKMKIEPKAVDPATRQQLKPNHGPRKYRQRDWESGGA